jgi:hypothetical protein
MFNSDAELSQKIQCFRCRKHIATDGCQCSPTEPAGRNYQFMLEDQDLPAISASLHTHILFWVRLVSLGPLTKQFDVKSFYEDQMTGGLFDLFDEEDITNAFYSFWEAYTESQHFHEVIMRTFSKMTPENLKLVGKQGLDSYFSGRWYELCQFSISLIMNALNVCGPDPRAPTSARLGPVVQGLMLNEAVLKSVSAELCYALIDEQRSSRMSSLAAYTILPTATEAKEEVEEK